MELGPGGSETSNTVWAHEHLLHTYCVPSSGNSLELSQCQSLLWELPHGPPHRHSSSGTCTQDGPRLDRRGNPGSERWGEPPTGAGATFGPTSPAPSGRDIAPEPRFQEGPVSRGLRNLTHSWRCPQRPCPQQTGRRGPGDVPAAALATLPKGHLSGPPLPALCSSIKGSCICREPHLADKIHPIQSGNQVVVIQTRIRLQPLSHDYFEPRKAHKCVYSETETQKDPVRKMFRELGAGITPTPAALTRRSHLTSAPAGLPRTLSPCPARGARPWHGGGNPGLTVSRCPWKARTGQAGKSRKGSGEGEARGAE